MSSRQFEFNPGRPFRAFLFRLAMFALLGIGHAHAFDPVSTRFFGGAIGGYDATAYFMKDKPVRGDGAHVVVWRGAKWRFADPVSAARFKASPEAYAPQFGGYCTNAMSMGKVVDGDPEIWRIHDGKLYLFYAKSGRDLFDVDPAAMIGKASRNWARLNQ